MHVSYQIACFIGLVVSITIFMHAKWATIHARLLLRSFSYETYLLSAVGVSRARLRYGRGAHTHVRQPNNTTIF